MESYKWTWNLLQETFCFVLQSLHQPKCMEASLTLGALCQNRELVFPLACRGPEEDNLVVQELRQQ
jgi:hypothetical protein